MVTTIHGFSGESILPAYRAFGSRAHYVSISDADRHPDLAYLATVHHGVDLAEFTFQHRDPEFPRRAKEWGGGFIVAGDNYGQGSSREHAALAPAQLGVRAVIAKSFARIHRRNLIAQGIMVLVSEALALGVKSGLTLDRIVEVIANTHAANNQLLHVQPYKAFSGNFKAGFMTALAAKDQRLIMGLAESLGVDLPMGRVMRDAFQAAIAAGYAHDDCCSVNRIREQAAGVEVRLQDRPGR